jgi:hypothetical protein
MPTYYTAIILCEPQPITGATALKYRNIDERRLEKFIQFAYKFPGVHHINFYDKVTKEFVKQVRPEVGQN